MLTDKPDGFRYFIELAFNGTNFHGWQVQPGEVTVQEVLNHAVGTLTGEKVNLVGCGRTDSGVHASHYVAHFDTVAPLADCSQLALRLNRFVGHQIRIDRIVGVPHDFHARYHALSRTYQYFISTEKSPFMNDFSWTLTMPLDAAAMNASCGFLLGRHDFTSFSKLHTDVKTNYCEVFEAGWTVYPGMIVFRVRADRFLRNMVRAIVGTQVAVGKGRLKPDGVQAVMNALDRSKAGMSVPAKGLFLTRVEYDPDIFAVQARSPFSAWF